MKKYLVLWLMLAVAACGQVNDDRAVADATPTINAVSAPHLKMANAAPRLVPMQIMAEATEMQANTAQSKKYLALRHYVQIESPAAQVRTAFDAAVSYCSQLNCQLLSTQYQRETQYSPPSANISLRLPPLHVDMLLTGLAKQGEVLQHRRDAEDKTNQVVDTDARIKNLNDLRDRLRQMLLDKSAKFRDVIDVQRELANTQSQLDSYASMRKVLAQETELVAMNIDFVAAQGVTEVGFFAPVLQAIQNAGHVLMESVATVITFLMRMIPWLLIAVPLCLLLRRYWQRYKVK